MFPWCLKAPNVLASLNNVLKKKKPTSGDRWRNSWILNIALLNAFCWFPPPMSLKHSLVYSPSLITMPLTFPPNSTINLEIRRTGNSPPPTWWWETPKVIYQTTKPSIQILLEIRLNLGKWGIAAVSTKFGCVGFNVIHETKRHRENSRSTYRVQNLTT